MRRLLPLLLLVAAPLGAQDDPPAHLPGLNEGLTRSLAVRYERARHWALRGFVLLALGERWHPAGCGIVLDALQSQERNLRVYALECLARTDPDALRRVASRELVEELVRKQLREKHVEVRERVHQVLVGLFPDARVEDPDDWGDDWGEVWRARQAGYAPLPWIGPEPPKGDGRTSAVQGVERAFDLHEAGLDVVICIDTTGSMQPTIDAARDAVDDLVTLLVGIAPRFRLGLVEYKDFVDLSQGAQVLEPLTARPERVRKRLARTVARGGGDFPEAVAAGIQVALGPEVDWQRGTNKLLLVIGDAPPKQTERAIELARGALQRPFGVEPSDLSPSHGRTRAVVRPIVTAAVGVGAVEVPRPTEKAFMRLAQAGGGAYAQLLTRPNAAQHSLEPPSEAIARHVLTLAFGSRWAGQVEVFVEVYTRYHRNGFLR